MFKSLYVALQGTIFMFLIGFSSILQNRENRDRENRENKKKWWKFTWRGDMMLKTNTLFQQKKLSGPQELVSGT